MADGAFADAGLADLVARRIAVGEGGARLPDAVHARNLRVRRCGPPQRTPVIEAAEQTILQRSIPYQRQGRVFGIVQLVENAASPLTAFLMAPLAEAVFIPLMTNGAGATSIGSWFGTGPERGFALMFTLAGLLGVAATALAWASRSYRRLKVTAASDTTAVPAGTPA